MKEKLLIALEELNGLIFKGLREDNPDEKMVSAMFIALRMGQIKMMIERLDDSCLRSEEDLPVMAGC